MLSGSRLCAEPVLGPAFGGTRGLRPGRRSSRVSSAPSEILSRQRHEIGAEAIRTLGGGGEAALDGPVGAPPDRHSLGEERAPRRGERQATAALVGGIDRHRDEAAPLKRL